MLAFNLVLPGQAPGPEDTKLVPLTAEQFGNPVPAADTAAAAVDGYSGAIEAYSLVNPFLKPVSVSLDGLAQGILQCMDAQLAEELVDLLFCCLSPPTSVLCCGEAAAAGVRRVWPQTQVSLTGAQGQFETVISTVSPQPLPHLRREFVAGYERRMCCWTAQAVASYLPVLAQGGDAVFVCAAPHGSPANFALLERLRFCFEHSQFATPISAGPGNLRIYFVGRGFRRRDEDVQWALALASECYDWCPQSMVRRSAPGYAQSLAPPAWAQDLDPFFRAVAQHYEAWRAGRAVWCDPRLVAVRNENLRAIAG